MFSQPTKIPHSSQTSQEYIQSLLKAAKVADNFSLDKFEDEIKKKMSGFTTLSLEKLSNDPYYISTAQSESVKPLIIGSGPILDAYKGSHEALRKKDATHTWPEAYYPELTGGNYDRNSNIAFVYAGIVNGKTFEIITPLDLLLKRAANQFYSSDLGGAFVELVWLLRNGYSLMVSQDGKLLAKPSAKAVNFELALPTMTQKFFHTKEATNEMEKIAAIWNKFSIEEVNKVKTRWATQLIENEQYVNAKDKAKSEFGSHLTDAKEIISIEKKLNFI